MASAALLSAGFACGSRAISGQDGHDGRDLGVAVDGPAPAPDGPVADQRPPPPGWATDDYGGQFIAVDPAGRIYLAGSYGQVVALSPAGKKRWILSPSGKMSSSGIGVGPRGHPCLVGYGDSVKLGQFKIAADQLVVAGLRSSGKVSWVFQQPAKYNNARRDIFGVALDAAGTCYATGSFVGRLVVEGTTLASLTNPDLFLAAFSESGKARWAVKAGGLMIDLGRSAAAMPGGGVAIAGTFWNTAEFGKKTITAAGNYPDVFVARYDDRGAVQWVVPLGSYNNDWVQTVAADAAGNLYLLGSFDQETTIGTVTLKGMDSQSQGARFLAKLGAAGKVQWALAFDGTEQTRMAVDSRGTIYLASTHRPGARLRFGTRSGTREYFPTATMPAFWSSLAWLSNARDAPSVRFFGYKGQVYFFDVAVGGGDRCHVTGAFRETLVLDRTTLKAPLDSSAGFVWKL